MRGQWVAAVLAAAALLGGAAPALAEGQSCFFVNQWSGWKAANDHTIYIGVSNGHRIYRLDMAGSCPALNDSTSTLITNNHTDFDLLGHRLGPAGARGARVRHPVHRRQDDPAQPGRGGGPAQEPAALEFSLTRLSTWC